MVEESALCSDVIGEEADEVFHFSKNSGQSEINFFCLGCLSCNFYAKLYKTKSKPFLHRSKLVQ